MLQKNGQISADDRRINGPLKYWSNVNGKILAAPLNTVDSRYLEVEGTL